MDEETSGPEITQEMTDFHERQRQDLIKRHDRTGGKSITPEEKDKRKARMKKLLEGKSGPKTARFNSKDISSDRRKEELVEETITSLSGITYTIARPTVQRISTSPRGLSRAFQAELDKITKEPMTKKMLETARRRVKGKKV